MHLETLINYSKASVREAEKLTQSAPGSATLEHLILTEELRLIHARLEALSLACHPESSLEFKTKMIDTTTDYRLDEHRTDVYSHLLLFENNVAAARAKHESDYNNWLDNSGGTFND